MQNIYLDALDMITASQLRASRALLGIDQRKLADLSGLSPPTIQRMGGERRRGSAATSTR
jgi:predicted transcriptional regulator